MVQYLTFFELTTEIKFDEFDEAADYLKEENMLQYLHHQNSLREKLESIYWYLDTLDSGRVVVTSKVELTENELEILSNFIKGQNSDGLGESFSQQSFSHYDLYWELDIEEEYWITVNFDWKTNDYKLTLVE